LLIKAVDNMKNGIMNIFGFDAAQHRVRTEIYAGITTFLTMAYILAVNPSIFSALEPQGMPSGAVFTATVLASVVGTLAMALHAKKPFGLAPGMGINAFFVFGVCLGMGYSWQMALTAVFIEGLLFILLSLFKIREQIANAIPTGMKSAIGGGIGLFIAFIGLQHCGIVVADKNTQVTLANFNTPEVQLALIGFVICGLMVVRNIRGGLLWGILLTALVGIPMGVTHLDEVFSAPPSVAPIFLRFEWHNILTWDMLIVVMTFLFVDLFDTIGTVIAVSLKAGMVDKDGKVDGVGRMLMADAVATTAGACLGTSTTTTYVESAAGVAVGGRTGLTAFVVAVCFLLSLFFAPLFLAIPAAATGPALVIVGVMMCANTVGVDWDDQTEAIPAFVTMLMMPLSYSISDGIMLGVIMYVLMKVATGKKGLRQISPTMWVMFVIFVLRYVIRAIDN
jgi:AGZA family xanthine/uracil permease-like MFS transporter